MKTDVDVYYDDNGWWDRVVGEIKGASSVVLGSYLYDDEELHAVLLKRLKPKNSTFTCVVLVDQQSYEERACKGELAKLQELQSAGAQVFSCSGHSGKDIFGPKALPGFFHVKAIAIDRKIVYCGSSNLTKSSRKNVELVTRMVGPPALAVLQGLAKSQSSGHHL
jgi:phosphatidylserine/phosphatidylglycerophosphate/cardiolipin synthase-like enzyme